MPMEIIRKTALEIFSGIARIETAANGGCDVVYDNGDTAHFLQSANFVAGEVERVEQFYGQQPLLEAA